MNKDYLAPTVKKPVQISPPLINTDDGSEPNTFERVKDDFHIRENSQPIYDRGQFFLDMMDMVRGMEMMDEMIRCECKVGILRTNRLLAITNSDGSTIVEAARFGDLFIKLSRGEYVGRKD